jgi:pilus assembly protein CpaE
MSDLSIVVVGPNELLRRQVCDAVTLRDAQVAREYAIYPDVSQRHALSNLTEQDVLLVELDSDPEAGIDLVRQAASSTESVTVMVYSATKDADLVVRCMQVGAREFLAVPLNSEQLSQALQRAASRRPDSSVQRPRRRGRNVAFLGAKGGVGTTTLAANYALALQKETKDDVCLVDLNTQLGDAALSLGLEAKFSVMDALESANRLDYDFLSALLAEHPSGLSVLAGPDSYQPERVTDSYALETLLDLLGQNFAYTVMDAGAGAGGDYTATAVQRADLVYLVVQADVATVRNAQRLIAHFQTSIGSGPRMELVMNRVGAKEQLAQSQVESTLGAKVRWSVPNDFRRIQDALNRGVSLAENASPVSHALEAMVRSFTGKQTEETGGSWLSLFKKAPAKG